MINGKCPLKEDILIGSLNLDDNRKFVLFFIDKWMLLLLSHLSCVRLCNPIDSSPLGSPTPGILQARTLEWVAISFSNSWKQKVKVKSLSHVWLSTTTWTAVHQVPPSTGLTEQIWWCQHGFRFQLSGWTNSIIPRGQLFLILCNLHTPHLVLFSVFPRTYCGLFSDEVNKTGEGWS